MNPNTRRDANGLTPSLRIGELGRRVGVRPETLRAWERRYGMLEPVRQYALEKLEEGTYGTCDACGQPIATARLRVAPESTLCIECARSRR